MTEEELFEAARHMRNEADRAAYLERACAADPVMRQRVKALLHSHLHAGGFLDQPVVEPSSTGTGVTAGSTPEGQASQPTDGVGSRIGPYKLLQLLGEGGMGAVFLAEQTEPVQRRVALKIIKAGMDSNRVIARFEAERQALAMMDHPHIARVLDAGTTGGREEGGGRRDEKKPSGSADSSLLPHPSSLSLGRPYFVMELVKGIPITTFCDQEHLTPKERLQLFIPVCQAVQHAHQKGIIHRDLKPSNVLIALYDGQPVPKVIDFGVAKATAQKLTERTMFTEVGQIVGTLEYMAPEQAELNNLDIDTRADIYSLGVLLYELLTGAPPFTAKQLRSAAFTEMLRMIREVEPAKPSTKLSGSAELPAIAAKRKLEPAKLAKLLRGDLDWIVMKCLEKERGRRYDTANGLAMDVQRYLADEAVLASPPSARYRLRKFVRKHRGSVVAAGIMIVLLLGGIVGTSLGFLRADRLRQVAEDREQVALNEKARAEASQQQAMDALKATTNDVIEQLLGAKPALGPAEKAFLQATLKRWQTFAAEQGESERARAIRAEGTFRVAYLRQNLGQNDDACPGYQEAINLYAQLAADFPDVAQYRSDLAQSHLSLGVLLADLGKRSEAEAADRQALAILGKLTADFPAVADYRQYLGQCQNNLGNLLRDMGRSVDAEAALRQGLAIQEKLASDFPLVAVYGQDLATSQNNLAILLIDLGQRPEAATAFRQALTIQEKLAADYPAVPLHGLELARSYINLGALLIGQGKKTEAETTYRQALAIQQKLVADFPAVPQYRQELAASQNNLGALLVGLGKRREAEAAIRQALAIREQLAGEFPLAPQHRHDLASSHNNLGALLADQGKYAEAEPACRQALAIREKLAADYPAMPQYRRELGASQANFANLKQSNHQPDEALQWYARSIDTLENVLRQLKVDTTAQQFLRNAHVGRARMLEDLQRYAEALKDWDRALELAPEPDRPLLLMDRAVNRAQAGQKTLPLAPVEELSKSADAITLYNAACIFARAAGRQQPTGSTLSKAACGARAMALLQQAIAKGYADAEQIKKDDDLKALRQRDDFRKLVAELERKSP
jgi:serine/threonine protein kinase/tetratricopeptide (TPR) repeat protein